MFLFWYWHSGNVSVPFGGEVELAQYNNKFLPEEAIEAAGLVGQWGQRLLVPCAVICTAQRMHPRMCSTASGLAFRLFWLFVLPFETSTLLFRQAGSPPKGFDKVILLPWNFFRSEWCVPGHSLQAIPRIHRLSVLAGDVQACGLHACQRYGGACAR